jgi:hypothetical protein
MKYLSLHGLALAGSVTLTFAAATACGDTTGLLPAVFTNVVDTVTLAALRGTPIAEPSGIDMVLGTLTRTEQGQPFDFVFDIDSVGNAVLLPAGLLGFQAQAGWRESTQEFDQITSAPTEDYTRDSPLALVVGDVFLGRSRNASTGCTYLGSLPRYGKFRVLELDTQERSVTLELLLNLNCGYRGLEPGVPES